MSSHGSESQPFPVLNPLRSFAAPRAASSVTTPPAAPRAASGAVTPPSEPHAGSGAAAAPRAASGGGTPRAARLLKLAPLPPGTTKAKLASKIAAAVAAAGQAALPENLRVHVHAPEGRSTGRDATDATIVCPDAETEGRLRKALLSATSLHDNEPSCLMRALQGLLRAQPRDTTRAIAVESPFRVTVFPRITINNISSIDSARQAWSGDVVVELLCLVRVTGRRAAAVAETVASATAATLKDEASEAAAVPGRFEIRDYHNPYRWVAFPAKLLVNGAAMDDLNLKTPAKLQEKADIESIVNYDIAGFEPSPGSFDGPPARERWVRVHRAEVGKDFVLHRNNFVEIRSVFSIHERLRGSFSQRFKLKDFPMDMQRLRIELVASRTGQFTFWKAPHDPECLPGWAESFLRASASDSGDQNPEDLNKWEEEERQAADDAELGINVSRARWKKAIHFAKNEARVTSPSSLNRHFVEHAVKSIAKPATAYLWPWKQSDDGSRGAAAELTPTPTRSFACCTRSQAAAASTTLPAGSFIVVSRKSMAIYSEWEIMKAIHEKSSKTLAEQSRSAVVYDKFVFSVVATRKPLRVLVSKVFPSFLITSSAFAAESISPDDASSRLAIIITLMLTAVVVHSDVSGSFEELTLVAKYSISCLAVLVLCTLEVAIAKAIVLGPWSGDASPEFGLVDPADGLAPRVVDGYAFDFVAWQVLLALWLCVNLAFSFRIGLLLHERDLLLKRDEEHRAHMASPQRAAAAAARSAASVGSPGSPGGGYDD